MPLDAPVIRIEEKLMMVTLALLWPLGLLSLKDRVYKEAAV